MNEYTQVNYWNYISEAITEFMSEFPSYSADKLDDEFGEWALDNINWNIYYAADLPVLMFSDNPSYGIDNGLVDRKQDYKGLIHQIAFYAIYGDLRDHLDRRLRRRQIESRPIVSNTNQTGVTL